jgi:hypothetical protein
VGEARQLTSKERAKDKRLREIYSMSLEDHNAKRDKQNHACAICSRPFRDFTAYQDHDHKCCPRRLKRFCGLCNRGLTCYLCNKYAVGFLEFLMKMNIPIENVIAYVKFWDAEIARKGGYAPKAEPKRKRKKSRVARQQKVV